MEEKMMLNYLNEVVKNMPNDWFDLTTHRLDIYDEKLAKTQFLNQFQALYEKQDYSISSLNELPTAYDYIRLGHPLSCILEWAIGKLNNIAPKRVISFSSKTMPILAILRKNLLEGKDTQINYTDDLPEFFDTEVLRNVYGYDFVLKKVESADAVSDFNGSTILISHQDEMNAINLTSNIDFYIGFHSHLGSIVLVNDTQNESYVSEIQHVRRRETIAMTPANALDAIKLLINRSSVHTIKSDVLGNKTAVRDAIKSITNTTLKPLVASSGLSMQYAILMGLIHDAIEEHKGKKIKIVVPPNCYGGTNDQARRIAACIELVDIMDLPVDGDHDMVQSIDLVLDEIAKDDAVPYIIAEIPTNPRVEVPDLVALKKVLSKERKTNTGSIAIDPVFILDQTFCPNIQFLGKGEILSTIRSVSYVSGSKFPSGGLCNAGYCVGNSKTERLMDKIEKHLILCDNKARNLQMAFLAKQLPSMNQRIKAAYKNTREFVTFIKRTLPDAKINFVSEELANKGFTPSVFSLDLPTKGNTDEERESYKRALNHKLIHLMITEIPNESKYCVSYGQLKGCYWTIPATSTQGTTKEGDKDYIARVALSGKMDMELHKKVFLKFAEGI